MTEEIMPREDRMGKILTFIGGCLAGVIGVFTVAAMSELNSSKEFSATSCDNCGQKCQDQLPDDGVEE